MYKKLLALSVLAAISSQAGAFEFQNTPEDLEIRWDNTFKFNVVSRVGKHSVLLPLDQLIDMFRIMHRRGVVHVILD